MIKILNKEDELKKCFIIGKGFIRLKEEFIKAAEAEDWDEIDDLFIKLSVHVGKISMCNAKEDINLKKIHRFIKEKKPIYIKELIE